MKTLIVAAIRCSLMFTAVAVFALAHPVKANLITNGGFETGDFTGWTVFEIGTPFTAVVGGAVGGISPHSGAFQAASDSSGVFLTQSVTTTPGASYIVDFWLAAAAENGAISSSVLWAGSVIFGQAFFSSSGYTEHTFTLTAPSATTELQFFSSSLAGFFLLDDVSVNPAGVPDAGSTLPLLSFALLGVAVLRRKLRC